MQIRSTLSNMKSIANATRAFALMSLSGLTAFAALPLHGADRFAAGQYDFTIVISGKTQTSSLCKTADEAKAINADAKEGRLLVEKLLQKNCTVKTYDINGNTVSYSMVCDGSVVVSSSVSYAGDSFEGDNVRTFGGTVHTSHIKAKRTGICKSG